MEGPFHPETIVSRDFASRLISSTLMFTEETQATVQAMNQNMR